MISMIKIVSDKIVKKNTIEGLGLKYSEAKRIGFKDDTIQELNSYGYYLDELEKEIIEDENGNKKTKWWKIKENGEKKNIENYYRYNRVENPEDYVKLSDEPQLIDLLEFAPKATHLEYKIVKTVSPKDNTVQGIQLILAKIEEKITTFNSQIESVSNSTFNQKVNVHTGGGLLITYNDLKLKENCCTDELQRELNNGWRIVSVCVQNDQRRPDYVLGRYNPELDTYKKDGAER